MCFQDMASFFHFPSVPPSYKQLSIGDHENSANIFNNSEFLLYRTLRWLRCGLTNAWRSHETPFGRLTCIMKFNYSIILIYSVNWAIDNKNVKVSSYRLLNQLGVTAPIESLHNLIETHKSDRPRHFVTFLRN